MYLSIVCTKLIDLKISQSAQRARISVKDTTLKGKPPFAPLSYETSFSMSNREKNNRKRLFNKQVLEMFNKVQGETIK